MAKYSFDFKMKIVQAYKNGEVGMLYHCNKYSIPTTSILRIWINSFLGGLDAFKKI